MTGFLGVGGGFLAVPAPVTVPAVGTSLLVIVANATVQRAFGAVLLTIALAMALTVAW